MAPAHRVRQFKLSKDPEFVDKLRHIVGLYVDPPAHAIVLSVDEKSQIQALDRTQPGLPIGAICPARGVGAVLALPYADADMMQLHLDEISRNVADGAHAVLLLDRAGWHTTGKLDVPDNITPIFLPSRAPELNPVENVWQYLRQNWLSTPCSKTTTQSSTPHAPLGENSSLNPKRSPQSECATGLMSVRRYDLWLSAHGASESDPFDVVIPSMLGYGFSGKPTTTGWDPAHIARAWVVLMECLGYTTFVAQGGDWGAIITDVMATQGIPNCSAFIPTCPRRVSPRH
jgi:hypothetical protein